MKKLSSIITAVLFAACISLNAFASTITVNWDGTGDFLTIQDAIDTSIDGDIIILMPGVYAENVDYFGKNITLQSSEPTNPTIIETTQITPPDNYVIGSDGTFEGFRLNGGFRFGGAGGGDETFSPTIRNCHIVSLVTVGINCKVPYNGVNYPLIENNIIEAQTGIYIFTNAGAYGSFPIIRNNTFIGKGLTLWGCGIQYRDHHEIGEIYNNIFTNFQWGILFTYDSLFEERIRKIQYNNFYGNKYNYYSQGVEFDLTGVNGNISNDPLFVGYANGDYHLQEDSPSIDAGDPNYVPLPDATDYEGNPRIDNGIVDMGAYEFIHPVEVSIDIKPHSCPNPVNVKSKGVLPVAILGSDSLDVNDIDFNTILLEGVGALRGSYEDVAAPVIDETECACTSEGADGYVDLSLKFDSAAILSVLGEVADEEMWMLNLTGYLKDGTPIEGADCIIIKKKGK